MSVAQGREKTVDAVRWAIVVLAVLTAWECARSINMITQQKGVYTSTPLLKGGLTSSAEVLARVSEFVECNGEVLVACLFTLAMAALVTRMLFASPLLDFLYIESPASNRRTMVGFLITTAGLLVQMGLLYAIALFARPEEGVAFSGMVPMLMVLFLAVGALWMLLVRIGAKKEDKQALRGFWPAFAVNVLVGGLLAAGVWYLGGLAKNEAAEFHGGRLHNLSVASVAALFACSLDTFFQGRLYGKRGKGSGLRTVLMLVLLLALLAAGGYLVYKTGPFGGV